MDIKALCQADCAKVYDKISDLPHKGVIIRSRVLNLQESFRDMFVKIEKSPAGSSFIKSLQSDIALSGKDTIRKSKRVIRKSKKRLTASKKFSRPYHETLEY